MDWAITLVAIPVFAMSLCFQVLLNRSAWQIIKEHRRELAARPDPKRKREVIQGFAASAVIFLALGAAFYLGSLGDGIVGGVVAAVSTLVGGMFAALAYALKSAWVKTP